MTLHHGDCVDVMAGMDPESVDAVVTDPPYGLEFMGKEWDRLGRNGAVTDHECPDFPPGTTLRHYVDGSHAIVPVGDAGFHAPKDEGRTFTNASGHMFDNLKSLPRYGRDARQMQAWHQQWAEAAYRVAKPSAYLLAFGGTRTVHRMTVALEDAGWIIRDMLVWGYACLSDDTEILTEEGWVRYNRTSVGQLAAAFDPDSGELRWQAIEAVHAYAHTGQMADVGPQRVTLNHRVVLDAETARVPRLPGVWNSVHAALGVGQEGERVLLLEPVQRQSAAARSAVPHRDSVRLDGGVATLGVREDVRAAQSGLEGRRYRVQEAWELLGGPVHPSSGLGAPDGPQGRLRHGTPTGRGGGLRLPADQDGMREPREPRSDRQPPRELDPLAGQSDAQALRVGQVPSGNGYPDAVRLVDGYDGVVWCITVATGAFVARRNGVVFVTGNSGFPKSKASLKPAWEPIVMARKPGPLRMLAIDECRIPVNAHDAGRDGETSASTRYTDNGATNMAALPGPRGGDPAGRWPANIVLTDPIFDGGIEGVVGGGYQESTAAVGAWAPRGAFPIDNPNPVVYGDSGTYSRFFSIPITMGVCRYCGVPIADETSRDGETTATPSGTAPVNASSLPNSSRSDPAPSADLPSAEVGGSSALLNAEPSVDAGGASRPEHPSTSGTGSVLWNDHEPTIPSTPSGRRRGTSPRSTSRSDRAMNAGPIEASSDTTTTTPSRLMCASCADLAIAGYIPDATSTGPRASRAVPADSPDHTRFLIIPKADWADREPVLGGHGIEPGSRVLNSGSSGRTFRDGEWVETHSEPRKRANSHPTVKPTELMRHLVRLVTPAGGTVLDPFGGSGTTALAAEMEGFQWVLIEKEEEYVRIAEARLNGTQRGMGLVG